MLIDVRPVATEADYEWALAEVEQYFDEEPEVGTPDSLRFDVLAKLIEAYELQHWRIEAPDPLSAIHDAMARLGLGQAALGKLLGSRSRASEILGGKRGLTMEQARLLNREWQIPAEVLLQPMPRTAA